MLEIAFVRGGMDTIRDFTDYEVDSANQCFLIYRNEQVVGVYNMEHILYIKFKEED